MVNLCAATYCCKRDTVHFLCVINFKACILNNYIAKEPPTVVKAMENINGEWKQIDHSEYQKMVEKGKPIS